MDPEESAIHDALVVRAGRSDSMMVAAELRDVTDLDQNRPIDAWLRRLATPIRALATTTAVLVVAGAIVIIALRPAANGGPATSPIGLFQGQQPVDIGVVGSKTCVAVKLDDDAYRSGVATAWWWQIGVSGCQSSVSGPMPVSAKLRPVALIGPGDLRSRTGYTVEFVLQLLPSGSERVAFTLDPGQGPAESNAVAAFAGDGPAAANNAFDRITKLDVTEPGGPSIPTPAIP